MHSSLIALQFAKHAQTLGGRLMDTENPTGS
jgi:hypothetical protein